MVEMDQYPPGVQARQRREGHLPPGMSMVSFRVRGLDDLPVPVRGAPRTVDGVACRGSRVAVIEGNAGEWLELIEGDQP